MAWSSNVFLWVFISSITLLFANAQTCDFGTGVTFVEGEELGDLFTTRCGSAAEFPCYCDPDANPQVRCPYCGIATEGGGLECVRIDGSAVSLVNLAGVAQTCSCFLNNEGNPESICVTTDNDDSTTPVDAPSQDVCTIEWDDGTTQVFENGESYGDLFTTRCGSSSDFPCYCDTSIPSKLYCPYCGVVTNTGDLSCGMIDQTFVLTNASNVLVSCFCGENLESTCVPAASLTGPPTPIPIVPTPTPSPVLVVTSHPTVVISSNPTVSTSVPTAIPPEPTIQPANSPLPPFFGTFPPATPTLVPTSSPQTEPPTIATPQPFEPLPTFDKPTILAPSRTPPIEIEGCPYEENNGVSFVATGEAVDTNILKGPCAPTSSFPVLCNPSLPGFVEYPYCVFTADGELDDFVVCAKSGDSVSVLTTTGTAACSCLYLNPSIGPVSTCPDLLVNVPLALTLSPSAFPSATPSTPIPTIEPTTIIPSTATPTDVSEGAYMKSPFLDCFLPLASTALAILVL